MTTQFTGNYFDGKSSRSYPVTASVSQSGFLIVEGADAPAELFRDLKITPRVGNGARYLEYSTGARIETQDNDQIDKLLNRWTDRGHGWVHALESSSKTVALSAVVLVVAAWVFAVYGIPALSGVITAFLPTSLDDRLGAEVLEQLDDLVFTPTSLPNVRQQELRELFVSLLPESDRDYRLEFRRSEAIGANAFALPNAQIVFTDELIALSEDDDMIAAIMLHEIGHVEERHSMQAVVSQAGLSMALFVLTGDVNSAATALIVLLPTVLIQSGYSRNLEWEADGYALREMLRRGIDPSKFADIMENMMASLESETDDADESESNTIGRSDAGTEGEEGSSLDDYFSTHPASQRRIQRFRDAAAGLQKP